MRAFLPLLLFLAACPDDDPIGPTPIDAGADAFVRDDGGRDAGVDSGRDADIPLADASFDASSDAAVDASSDASFVFDAIVPMDAGSDTGDACAVRDVYARIEFTSVSSTSGCYFLSGPAELGLEYQLGDEGRLVDPTRLTIGAAEFVATPTGFERSRQCPGPFRFSEVFDGTWAGDVGTHPACAATPAVFTGTYEYSECQVLPSRLCPPTRCTITANVTISLLSGPPVPMPMDAGVDGGHDAASICEAACAAQDAAAVTQMCAPNPTCVMDCASALAPTNPCLDEAVASRECAARVGETAWDCIPAAPAVGFFLANPGPCQVEDDHYRVCFLRPPPSGMCGEPVLPTGTGVAGDGCATNDDCAAGFFCDAAMCSGAGTCAPHPSAVIDCLLMGSMEVCGCDGTTYFNECRAHYDGIRVEHGGACTP